MAAPKPSLTPSALRFIFAVIGAVVFLTVNFFMFVSRCTTNEFMVNCGGSIGRDTVVVIVMAAAVGLIAFLGARGRGFAEGFFGCLLALGIFTAGGCTPSWVDPYWSVRRIVHPYKDRWERDRRHADMQRGWIDAMNAKPMDIRRGVAITGGVVSCAFQSNGSIAQNESEIADFCQALRNVRKAVDPGPPSRYLIPRPSSVPDSGFSVPEGSGDDGWRLTYTATPTAFAVDAEPDEQLAHRWPRVHIDSSGRAEVRLSAEAPPAAIAPMDDLRTMAVCLREIPAEEERRRARRGGLSYGWFLTSMTKLLCPSLQPRLQALVPNDENATRLAALVPAPESAAPTVAVYYKVTFVRRQTAAFEFDLVADAMAAGLPHYLATVEGQIHTTMERRSATKDDPVIQ